MKTEIEQYMREAIAVARQEGTPYGAVLVDLATGQKIVVANSVGLSGDPTAHAEVNAIRQAAANGLSLERAVLISTCEPCPMCAMAAVWAGVPAIYFGASIDDAAAHGRQVRIYCREVAEEAWYELKVEGGVLREECRGLFEK